MKTRSANYAATFGNVMNEDQEELFGRYVAEFALAHDLKLDDDDILKVVDLFDECTERWKTDVSVSIADMASDIGFTEKDEHIIEMVSFVWKRMYSN